MLAGPVAGTAGDGAGTAPGRHRGDRLARPRSPNPIQRRLAKPDAWWQRVLAAMRDVLADATRHDLAHVTAATGVKPLP
jgi:sugar (pentulose or hexulose) kinase